MTLGNANTASLLSSSGRVTTNTYNSANEVVSTKDPLNRTTRCSYDLAGNLALRAALRSGHDATEHPIALLNICGYLSGESGVGDAPGARVGGDRETGFSSVIETTSFPTSSALTPGGQGRGQRSFTSAGGRCRPESDTGAGGGLRDRDHAEGIGTAAIAD